MEFGVRILRGLAVCCLVLGGTLVGAGTMVVASAGVAAAQSASSIVVQGNRRVEAETVRSYFKPGPGGRLGPAQIDDAIHALYATGLFEDVHLNHGTGAWWSAVVENPVINRVAFEGNKKAKDEQLKAEIQSKARGTLSKPMVQADVQRIIEIYHRSGRFDVSVDPKIIELPNNRVDLVFEIKEGEKTGVKDIRFVGNTRFLDRPSEGRDQDDREQFAQLPADHRHLRSRPRRSGPRPVAPVLSQARLCRRADRVGGRRIRPGQEGLHRHLHHRRRQPVPHRHRRRGLERARAQSGVAARQPQDQRGQRLQRRPRREERRRR